MSVLFFLKDISGVRALNMHFQCQPYTRSFVKESTAHQLSVHIWGFRVSAVSSLVSMYVMFEGIGSLVSLGMYLGRGGGVMYMMGY